MEQLSSFSITGNGMNSVLRSGVCLCPRTPRARARCIKTEVLDLSTQLLPRDAQQPCGSGLVVEGMFERSHDVPIFQIRQRRPLLIFLSHIQPTYTRPRQGNSLSKIYMPPLTLTTFCYGPLLCTSHASRWMHLAARRRSHGSVRRCVAGNVPGEDLARGREGENLVASGQFFGETVREWDSYCLVRKRG